MKKELKVLVVCLNVLTCVGCGREVSLEIKGWKKTGETDAAVNVVSGNQFSDEKNKMLAEFGKEYKNNPSGYFASELGMLLWNCKGNNKKALGLINKSLIAEPNDIQILLNAADVFSLCDNNSAKVIDLLERVNEIESKSDTSDSYKAEILFGIGTIYERINRFEKAVTFYSKALSLQPDDLFLTSSRTFVIKHGLNEEYRTSLKRVLKKSH